jgi:hypothetical protein
MRFRRSEGSPLTPREADAFITGTATTGITPAGRFPRFQPRAPGGRHNIGAVIVGAPIARSTNRHTHGATASECSSCQCRTISSYQSCSESVGPWNREIASAAGEVRLCPTQMPLQMVVEDPHSVWGTVQPGNLCWMGVRLSDIRGVESQWMSPLRAYTAISRRLRVAVGAFLA